MSTFAGAAEHYRRYRPGIPKDVAQILDTAVPQRQPRRLLDIGTDPTAQGFAPGSFDAVVSCAAVHNLYDPKDRERAISEIARVSKPTGHAVIADIRHLNEYAETFAANGCHHIRRVESHLMSVAIMLITFGAIRAGTLLARKS